MKIEATMRHRFGAFALDASFQIEKPGITALFGASGSGKTTTINALAGLFRPREGRITIGEEVVLDTNSGIFIPPRRRHVGYVFQDARLFPHLSVVDNLLFGWRRAERRQTASFDEVVDILGLALLLARKPASLSGGEKGRVALGRALLAAPAFLLLDEPLAALDAPRRAEIMPYFERLRDEARLPMIYVTHSVEELSRLADRVIVLKDGHVIRQEPVFELLSDLAFGDLAGIPSYGTVVPVVVSRQRENEHLTVLRFGGGDLIVPRIERPVGAALRVRIRAEDVLLALERPAAISANNVLQGTVLAVRRAGDGHADVQVECGAVRLVARITQASLDRLAIAPPKKLFAIVKSVTMDPRLQSANG